MAMEPDSVSVRVDGGSALRLAGQSADASGGATVEASRAGRSLSRTEAVAIRCIDLVVAILVLVLLSPLLLAIAIAIRATSHGPALFRQQRLGKGMSSFSLYKFRTMCPNASEAPHREYVQALISSDQGSQNGNLYKLTVDSRITKVGRFLRSWSFDELPQLLNVLRGEMSLVGPRPVIGYEVELYPRAYLRRFAVKPGLTGLWQVSGRNQRTYHEMVQFDIEYVERYSLWLDLKILGKTIPVVLGRRGVA
jgi:lipopolysaccharide/colanic/teichoic acid biosynthesis glycosyltransferase